MDEKYCKAISGNVSKGMFRKRKNERKTKTKRGTISASRTNDEKRNAVTKRKF